MDTVSNIDQLPPPSAQAIEELPTPPGSALAQEFSPGTPAPTSDVDSLPPPPPAVTAASNPTEAIDREIQDRSFFQRPIVSAEPTKAEEIQAIAVKHGVSPEALRDLAPYFGASMEGAPLTSEDTAKRAAGFAGQAIGLGVPQKLYKMAQDPDMEKALDEVQNLSQGRQSYLEKAGELAGGALVPLGTAGTIGKAVLHGAAIGAVAGAAGAGQGQEIQGAAFGAVTGGALSGVFHGVVSKLAARGATKAEQTAAVDAVKAQAPDIEKGVQDILDSRSSSAKDVEAAVVGKGADLDPEISQRVVRDYVDPETSQRILDPSEPDNLLYRQRAAKEIPDVVRDIGEDQAILQLKAQEIIDSRKVDFAEFLDSKAAPRTAEEADEVISRYASGQGGDAALADRYKNFETQDAAEKFVKDNYVRAGREDTFLNRALNHVSDAQFVVRDIDNRTGLGIERIHRDISRQLNRMSYARSAFRADLDSVFQHARATGVDDAIVGSDKIYHALDTGNLETLSPAEADIAQRFQDYFRKGLDYVNGVVREGKGDESLAPLSIQARDNYVPHQMLPIREIESKMGKMIEDSGIDLGMLVDKGDLPRELENNPRLRQVVSGLQALDNGEVPSTGPELQSRIHDLFQSRGGREAVSTIARAAQEREEGAQIPEWMRETNLYRLADKWATGTLRHLYLRDPIEKLSGKIKVLRRTGSTLEADYLHRLATDLQGKREGSAAAYTASLGDRWSRAIDRSLGHSENPVVQAAAGIAKALPSALSSLNREIYPNMLGLNGRAIIMNATQPLAKTLPEIGMTPYGGYSLARGALKVLTQFSEQKDKVVAQGLQPAEFVGKYRRAMEEGLLRGSTVSVSREILQKMATFSMGLYEKMDVLNRMLTLSASEGIARDLAAGSKAVQGALRRFPLSVQRDIERAAGDESEVSKIIASHLNASTQYNYNRASMSEFGRTMGPFFSTFTKWPTATAGEMIAEYRQKGLTRGTLRNMEKFLAPYLLLKGADVALKTYGGGKGDFTDRQKMLLGGGGLAGSAPVGSLMSVAQGKLFAPPALDVLLKGIVEPIRTGDASKVKNAAISALQEFTPGSVYARFLTDDLVTMITGHRPEGSNFIDRTAAGAKVLNKLGR